MTCKFEVGTVVMLKSGGPTMTVTSMRDQADNLVHCEWFAGTELKRDAFDTANLTTAIIPQFVPYVAPPFADNFKPWAGCAACANGGVCGCVRPDRMIVCGVSNSHGG